MSVAHGNCTLDKQRDRQPKRQISETPKRKMMKATYFVAEGNAFLQTETEPIAFMTADSGAGLAAEGSPPVGLERAHKHTENGNLEA